VELDEVGWVVAYAYNTLGHLHRRRGDFDAAEEAFRSAEERGTVSHSGLALVLLARGDIDAALRRMTRSLMSVPSPALARAHLLPAMVEIAVEATALDQAAAAAVELQEIAAAYDTAKLRGEAAMARGRLDLAVGDAPAACVALDASLVVWQQLGAPYEAARTRVLHARACRSLGDEDGCASQLRLAATTFRALGAAADLAEAEQLLGRSEPAHRGALTERETEVLVLVATGATNKQIAADLHLSEKTVSRHLGNIFTKIGVNTRAAATAFAFRNSIVGDRHELPAP
jgi:DNA-binding CsgD family transcriptional regulator